MTNIAPPAAGPALISESYGAPCSRSCTRIPTTAWPPSTMRRSLRTSRRRSARRSCSITGRKDARQELRYKFNLQLRIYHYDPAIPEWSAPPAPRRFVACIDVLEHIEPDLLDNVLDDLKRVVLGWVFSPCTRARRSRSCRTDATRI